MASDPARKKRGVVRRDIWRARFPSDSGTRRHVKDGYPDFDVWALSTQRPFGVLPGHGKRGPRGVVARCFRENGATPRQTCRISVPTTFPGWKTAGHRHLTEWRG